MCIIKLDLHCFTWSLQLHHQSKGNCIRENKNIHCLQLEYYYSKQNKTIRRSISRKEIYGEKTGGENRLGTCVNSMISKKKTERELRV